jgi:tetratricopeptide (TPR) repeat protein
VQNRLLAIYTKAYGPDDLRLSYPLGGKAGLRIAQKQYASAEPFLLKALAIREKALGPNDPRVASLLEHLADLYMRMGRVEDAKRAAARASQMRAAPG